MIRDLLFISGSGGLVLFHKAWYDACITPAKINTLGNAITTVQKLTKEVVSYIPSFVNFGEIGMSYTQDPTTLLQCVLFSDASDGEELGRLVSSQLLRSFLDEFDSFDFMKSTGMVDVSRFATFGTKLHDAIRSAVGPVLENLVAQKGLLQAIIVYEDGKTHADSGVGQEISLAANIQHLITLSRSFGQEKGGGNFTFLETPDKVVLIYRLQLDGSLVCICKRMIGQKLANKSEYMVSCAAASALLDKVGKIANNLHT